MQLNGVSKSKGDRGKKLKQAEQGMYASGQRGKFSLTKGGKPGRESGQRENCRKLGIMTNNKRNV